MSKGPKTSPAKIASLLSPETVCLELQNRQKIPALREVARLLVRESEPR